MQRKICRVLLMTAVMSLFMTLGVDLVYGQCGLPGTPPCSTNPQTSKKKPNSKKNSKTLSDGLIRTVAPNLPRKTPFPVLADLEIPGYSGILVESMGGNVVLDSYSNLAFNPASNVKIATAYAVMKTFGPDYRFPTSFWTDGQLDQSTGTLYGNVYVSGRDPMFNYEHAVSVAEELNLLGVRSISGNLIVTDNFSINYSGQAQASGNTLLATMNAAKRPAAATRSWENYLINAKKTVSMVPSVAISGNVYVQALPTNAKLIFSHESAKMREILKVTLCYSNNFLAERLGDMIGGPYAVARIVQQNAAVAPEEFYIQTSSGLGINRVTPRAMMKLLKTLRAELAKNKMNFTDIMPVAGIDKGTLEGRFASDFARGSVVGSTGTMENTDGGVSSLAGEIQTKNGNLLFVIFNNKGGVQRFRAFQNSLVSIIQEQMGGASAMSYYNISLDERLATTRIVYPSTRPSTSSSSSPTPEKKITTNNESSPFKVDYIGGNGLPVIQVINSSDRLLNLTISGKKYKIAAGSSESIVVEPGNNTFTASAVRVRTLTGTRGFDRGYRYTWEFRIITTTR